MRTKFNFLVVALFTVLVAACGNNKDAEKRIAELEARLAEVEGNKTPATTTAPTPAVKEEKPEGPLPAFEFEEEEFDFGTINEGDIVEHTFNFKNTGDAPLIIQSAKGSCGCTVPSWPKDPIAPGASAAITAKFNSKGKPNIQNKTITITANTWPKTSRLRIKAMVTPAAKESPAEAAPAE